MKELVYAHVKEEDEMFDLAATRVRNQLETMFRELTETRNHQYIATALGTIEKRYKNLISGTKIFASLEEMRDQLRHLLDGTDGRFELAKVDDAQMADVDDGQAPASDAPTAAAGSPEATQHSSGV